MPKSAHANAQWPKFDFFVCGSKLVACRLSFLLMLLFEKNVERCLTCTKFFSIFILSDHNFIKGVGAPSKLEKISDET